MTDTVQPIPGKGTLVLTPLVADIQAPVSSIGIITLEATGTPPPANYGIIMISVMLT